jgi:transcriptional regulator with XRE-family HTH domain
MKKQKSMKMVRELRQHLGLTQTEFASKLGQGMSTIQRYEQLVPPRGRALAKMIALAEKSGRPDIADVLRSAYADEVADNTAKSWLRLGARGYTDINFVISTIDLITDHLAIGAPGGMSKREIVQSLREATRRLRELLESGETDRVPQMEIPDEERLKQNERHSL